MRQYGDKQVSFAHIIKHSLYDQAVSGWRTLFGWENVRTGVSMPAPLWLTSLVIITLLILVCASRNMCVEGRCSELTHQSDEGYVQKRALKCCLFPPSPFHGQPAIIKLAGWKFDSVNDTSWIIFAAASVQFFSFPFSGPCWHEQVEKQERVLKHWASWFAGLAMSNKE